MRKCMPTVVDITHPTRELKWCFSYSHYDNPTLNSILMELSGEMSSKSGKSKREKQNMFWVQKTSGKYGIIKKFNSNPFS